MSHDVITLVCLFGSFYLLKTLFPTLYKLLREFAVKWFSGAGTMTDFSMGSLQQLGNESLALLAKALIPFLLICCVLAIVATGVQTRFLFTGKNFAPKFSRLNPMQGIKKLFSLRNVLELVKNLLKVTILLIIIFNLLKQDLVPMMRMMYMDVQLSASQMLSMIVEMTMQICMVFLVIAGLDFGYQWWDYERRLKMSKQEIKEEYKEMEGNPETKNRIRNIQRQRAQMRMMQAIPKADVIIRNPTHFAVALQYDLERNSTPVVVAKGQDELALRIVAIGEENGVTVLENKPLARALYAQCAVDQEIPAEYYGAVAEILVYVYKMNHKKMV